MQDIYTHNWYNRNTDTYVYGLPVSLTEKYVDSVYSTTDINKFNSNNNALINEFSEIIKFKFGKSPKIVINTTSETSYTDGKTITLADNFKYNSPEDRLDILFGLLFHEFAHCLYTDFAYVNSKNMFANELLSFIHNVLEDEEIENRIIKNNTTFGKYIAKVKFSIFGNKNSATGKKIRSNKYENELDEILTILFVVIRYPKLLNIIDSVLLEKHYDLFIKINDILINKECPAAIPFTPCSMYEDKYYDKLSITKSTADASFEIYRLLSKYFNEKNEDIKEQENGCKNGPDSIINTTGEDCVVKGLDNSSTSKGMQITKEHEDEYSGANSGDDGVSPSKDKVRTPNPTRYNKLLKDVLQYKKLVEDTIVNNSTDYKDKLIINRFRRNGNLDTNRLADAMQNINNVYTQRNIIKDKVEKSQPKYAFVMMIDESSSMLTRDKKLEFGFKTAILFYEVLSKYSEIEFYIYGHGDKINTYISKERKNKFVLGNYDEQGGQNEYISYNWIINDVKRQTNLPIVVLNITDFYYHSNDKDMIKIFDDFKHNNVSFNMLALDNNGTQREKAMCQRVLQGQVVSLKNLMSTDSISQAFLEIATILKNNYYKFCKK